jgi:hypothetical protein
MISIEENLWPLEPSVLEMKKKELRDKGLLDTSRKRSPKTDYKDEVGLMVLFIVELEILNEELLKLTDLQRDGNLNEEKTAECQQEIDSIRDKIQKLRNKFKTGKFYYIEAEKNKFEQQIIKRIYGPKEPEDESDDEEAVDVPTANAPNANAIEQINGDNGSPDNGDNESLDDNDSDGGGNKKKKRRTADDDDGGSDGGDENWNMAVGVNDDYDWVEAETTATWTHPNLLKAEFTLTRSDLGLPPVLFTPQTIQSLSVRDDCEALPTKLCVIVGVNDLYEQIARDIALKVHFLSKVDTIAFLVTTMDKKSKDAEKDDVKT